MSTSQGRCALNGPLPGGKAGLRLAGLGGPCLEMPQAGISQPCHPGSVPSLLLKSPLLESKALTFQDQPRCCSEEGGLGPPDGVGVTEYECPAFFTPGGSRTCVLPSSPQGCALPSSPRDRGCPRVHCLPHPGTGGAYTCALPSLSWCQGIPSSTRKAVPVRQSGSQDPITIHTYKQKQGYCFSVGCTVIRK